jgi:hypothetical protein
LRHIIYNTGLRCALQLPNRQPPRKPRCRPRVDSDLNIPMRINNELRGIVESENRHDETHNDTLLRIIRQRSAENQKLREKIRQLQEEIRLKSQEI